MRWRDVVIRDRERQDRERAEEFDEHLHLLVEHFVADGLSVHEATRRARLQFGNPRAKREEIDDLRRSAFVDSLWRDCRFTVRALRRSPAFTLTAILTLALGIGANTAVFSVMESVLLRPLPYRDPERLMGITYQYQSAPPGSAAGQLPSPPILAWQAQSRAFEAFGTYTLGDTTLLKTDGEPIRLSTAFISSNFFSVLGVRAVDRGRSFQPFDGYSDAEPVAIVSDRLWKQLGPEGRPVDEVLKLSGRRFHVVGVTEGSFRFPDYATPDVYVPRDLPGANRVVQSVDVIGRLRPAVSIEEAADELRDISRQAESTYPSAMRPFIVAGAIPHVTSLQHRIAGDLRGILLLGCGAVTCILLLACANVTSLLISRIGGRERELAMRLALGATPQRLVQSLLVESIVLTIAGAALALLTLWSLMAGLRGLLTGAIPHADAMGIDGAALAFVASTLVLTSTMCAAIPATRMFRRRTTPSARLASSGAIGTTTVRDSVRGVLVSGQVAAALVLLIGALLLLNTVWRLSGIELGFDAAHLLTLKISATGLGTSPERTGRVSDLLNRVRHLPGVTAAGATTALPLSGHAFHFTVPVEGEVPPPSSAQDGTGVDAVSAGFFGAMRIPLVGRDFDDTDGSSSPRVAIVNRSFGRLEFPGRHPIGRRLSLGGGPADADITVVGIVDDFKDGNPGESATPTVYVPFSQAAPQLGWHTAALVVRTSSDPSSFAGTLRREVMGLTPHSAVYEIVTMEDRVATTIAPQRQRAILFGLFAMVAVALAAGGLYGLLVSVVAQGRRELGVRMALGASRRDLIGLVLRHGMTPTMIGIVIGLVGALGFSRLLAGQVYGITTVDAMTYVTAAAAMTAVSLIASCLPAYRATIVDPLEVLRTD